MSATDHVLQRDDSIRHGLASTGETCRIYDEGDHLYTAMLEDIDRATETIRLESYIFSGDEVGWRFAEALAKRAQAGVTVRVHVDAAGALFEGTEKLFQCMHEAGVETHWFNRWSWRAPLRYNRRNHRKLLVVDQECIYVGGFNIHRESSQALIGAGRWRDIHVRLSGRLSDQAATLFDDLWRGRAGRTAPPWDGAYRLVPNVTRTCRRVLHCWYLEAFAAAEHTIYLTSPYFVPDRRFREALVAASERGVDVRVLLPAIGDNRFVRWAGYALARPLARAGVHFFEYLPRMLHTKLALVDDQWAMVGSANTDYRSFFVNRELNLVSRSPAFCRQLADVFHEDLSQAHDLVFPARRKNRLRALAELLGQRLRRWL